MLIVNLIKPTPIGNVDPDDWKPINEIQFIPSPAYPNPALLYSRLTLLNSIRAQVQIFVHNPKSNQMLSIINSTLVVGTHQVDLDLKPITKRPTYARVIFKITHDNKKYSTYGDIKIE